MCSNAKFIYVSASYHLNSSIDVHKLLLVSLQTQAIMKQSKQLEMSSFFKSLKRTADEHLKTCDNVREDAEEASWVLRKNHLRQFIKENKGAVNFRIENENDDDDSE